MSRLAKIQKTTETPPFRFLIYGVEGVGKSQFGAHAPKPIFISPEGGTDHLRDRDGEPVAVMPGIYCFTDILEAVSELTTDKHEFKTLVLDSADWIEKLAHLEIIGESKKDIIRVNGGYGAGYRESEVFHKRLISGLELLRNKARMNVVVTAHYHVRTVKDPESPQDYDAFEIKCHEYVSSLWREWVDVIAFARFETLVKANDENDKARAFGSDKRIMYTQKRPAFQAKNRYGLPFQMPVSFSEFEKYLPRAENREDVVNELNELAGKISKDKYESFMIACEKAGSNLTELIKIRNYARGLTR